MRDEFELISLLRERAAAADAGASGRLVLGSGDDAAISQPGGATATSVDAFVEGVHFRRETSTPRAIGAKALAAALSDLAAMGAEPGEAYVQLGAPQDASEDELTAIADGIAAVAAEHRVALAGGDLVSSPVLFLALTAVGHAARAEDLVRRSGARPGDALLVTGPVGAAAAGLLLVEGRAKGARLEPGEEESLRLRHSEPPARVAAGRALAAAGATAMIDLSDGLAGDARHLATASEVRLEVEVEAVPVAPGVAAVAKAAGVERDELALGGGEDYELLAALPPERLEAAVAVLREDGLDPARVGRVEPGEGVVLRLASGRELAVRGYDHRRSRARASPT